MTENKQQLTDSPEQFAKKSVINFLREHGAGGIMDTSAISTVLGTIKPRTIRQYTNKGELTPINPQDRWYVYTIETVADFLLKHPKFMMQRQINFKIDDKTPQIIRDCIHQTWSALLQHMTEDELVSEVIYKLMTQKSNGFETADIRVVVRRKLCDIWRKIRRDAMGYATRDYNDEQSATAETDTE